MKTILIFLIALVSQPIVSAKPTKWVEILSNPEVTISYNENDTYIDYKSVYVWTKAEYHLPLNKEYDTLIVRNKILCDKGTYSVVFVTASKKGQTISVDNEATPPEAIHPNTVMHVIAKKACKELDNGTAI